MQIVIIEKKIYLNSPHVNQTLRILCDQFFKTKPEEQLI